MHHETLLYMLQEQRPGLVRKPESAPAFVDGDGRAAEPRYFPAGEVTLGVDLDSIGFGWDNEIGHTAARLPAFTLDSLPVRNADYLAFLDARGAASRAALTPRAWTADGRVVIDGGIDSARVRTMLADRDPRTFLAPTAIAENYWNLHAQDPSTWSQEIDLRPSVEKF